MDIKLCGICGNPIGGKVFFFAYGHISESGVQERKSCRTIEEYREYLIAYESNIKNLEVCPICVKYINKAIKKRTKECLKLNVEYKNLLEYDRKNPMPDTNGNIKDDEDEVE